MGTEAQQAGRGLHIAMLTRVTIQHSMGGMELHAEMLRRGLTARGHRVTTITTALPTGPTILEDQWGATHFVGGAPGMYSEEWWRESVRAVLQVHADDPIDVIASQSGGARAYLEARSGLPVPSRIPAVVIVHGISIDNLQGHLKQIHRHPARSLLRWIPQDLASLRQDRRWLRLADRVTVLSQDTARAIVCWLRVSAPQVVVIPNGVDVERISADEARRAEIRQRLGIGDEATVILILGRLVPEKGQQYMLDALAYPRLRKYGDALRLVLAGDGLARERLENQSSRLGLDGQVVFAGRIPHDEVPAMLSAADIVALPSTSEGMPLSLLEAMASGHPIVASRVGAIPDIVQDGITGLLAPPGSSDALARAVDALMSNPELGRRLGSAGYAFVLAHHDQRAMITRYEQVMRDVTIAGVLRDSAASVVNGVEEQPRA